jgi:hypothetical protein
MGWRGSNAYDEEAERRRRALPWRERYNWRNLTIAALILAVAAAYNFVSLK